jgi:hypothetical protein
MPPMSPIIMNSVLGWNMNQISPTILPHTVCGYLIFFPFVTRENPVEACFSALVQTGPGAHPTSYAMGTRSFLGVKRPGRGVDRPTPSSAEVKERLKLYIYSPFGPSWPDLRRTFPLTIVTREVRNCKNKIRITSGLSRTQLLLQGKRAPSTRNTKSRQR